VSPTWSVLLSIPLLFSSSLVLQGFAIDRDVAISHLEKYISVTKTEEQFANDISALKEKIAEAEKLKSSGDESSNFEETDKALDAEVISQHIQTNWISLLELDLDSPSKYCSSCRWKKVVSSLGPHDPSSSAETRPKQTADDVRARLEKTFAKLGKELPDSIVDRTTRREHVERETPAPRDPEELKKLHGDMINKQKDFISHRKEVRRETEGGRSDLCPLSQRLLGVIVSRGQSWVQWRRSLTDERLDQ
jgi:hypothetical protein